MTLNDLIGAMLGDEQPGDADEVVFGPCGGSGVVREAALETQVEGPCRGPGDDR